MKEAFEAMLGAFLFAVMMIVCVSGISTSIDARNMDAILQAYVVEMEHSNFSPSVIKAIVDDMPNAFGTNSVKDGSITLYGKDVYGNPFERTIGFSALPSQIGDTSGVYMAKIEMTYDYALDFLDKDEEHTVVMYAR